MGWGWGVQLTLTPMVAPADDSTVAPDVTLLPSRESGEQTAVPPAQFGIARLEPLGNAVQGIIYEYEYDPKPVRKYSQEKPPDEECVGSLRPAVRGGRAPFRFFGSRVPASADHARCWLGRVLIGEVGLGRLEHVELIVPPAKEAPPPEKHMPLKAHGEQPSWRWRVWVAGMGPNYKSGDADRDAVEVTMHCSSVHGVFVDLDGRNDGCRCFVFRMLRQYCDSNCLEWHPIPEAPGSISKVLDRQAAKAGDESLLRLLDDLMQAEARLVQILKHLEATREVASLKDMLADTHELREALENAHEVRFKLKSDYRQRACEALELLLRRALKTAEDRDQLADVAKIAWDMHGFGIQEPESMYKVQAVLAHEP
uniref:Uncharacterized protein n=1 Tax=Alexandrium monilatum TaxID=311494 RepID=A0A7S4QL85_9DINO